MRDFQFELEIFEFKFNWDLTFDVLFLFCRIWKMNFGMLSQNLKAGHRDGQITIMEFPSSLHWTIFCSIYFHPIFQISKFTSDHPQSNKSYKNVAQIISIILLTVLLFRSLFLFLCVHQIMMDVFFFAPCFRDFWIRNR